MGLDTLTAGGLDNSGTMTLVGYRGSSYNASLIVTGAMTNEGGLALSSEAQASIGNSLVNTGSITLDASSSSGGATWVMWLMDASPRGARGAARGGAAQLGRD